MRKPTPEEAQDRRNGQPAPADEGKALAVQAGKSFAVQTADHVRQILTAAECSVERMRELAEQERRETEEQALRRLDAADRLAALADERLRRMLDLGDAVTELSGSIRTEMQAVMAGLERAEAGRRRVEELAETLRAEVARVEASARPTSGDAADAGDFGDFGDAPGATAAVAAGGASPLPRRTPADQSSTGACEAFEAIPDEQDARLMALHMAMGGRSRGEVESTLAQAPGAGDLDEILDEIFGAATPDTHTIAWRAGSIADGP